MASPHGTANDKHPLFIFLFSVWITELSFYFICNEQDYWFGLVFTTFLHRAVYPQITSNVIGKATHSGKIRTVLNL